MINLNVGCGPENFISDKKFLHLIYVSIIVKLGIIYQIGFHVKFGGLECSSFWDE